MREWRDLYRVLVGKAEGKRLLNKTRSRWDNNNKIELRDEGCGEWIGSKWLRIERLCEHS
jgi:hypothetical protein